MPRLLNGLYTLQPAEIQQFIITVFQAVAMKMRSHTMCLKRNYPGTPASNEWDNRHLRLPWLSLLLAVLSERPHGLPQTTYFGKEGWMDRRQERRSSWLKPHWLKLPLWFEQSLARFVVWTGRCCLYPLGGSYYKAFNEARERSHSSTAWSLDWNLTVAYRCIAWASVLH